MVNPEYADLPAEKLEELFEQNLGISVEEMENFLKKAGGFLKGVGQTVAPIALPAIGTVVGGPVGGLVGTMAAQGVGAALGSSGSPSRSPPRKKVSPRTSAQSRPARSVSASTKVAAPATAQLLHTLSRPETHRALTATLLGQMGQSKIKVGKKQVPRGAFLNLLITLAGLAAIENATSSDHEEEIPDYLLEAEIDDPASPEERAAVLWDLLQQTPPSSDFRRPKKSSYSVDDEEDFFEEEEYLEEGFDDEEDFDEEELFYDTLTQIESYFDEDSWED